MTVVVDRRDVNYRQNQNLHKPFLPNLSTFKRRCNRKRKLYIELIRKRHPQYTYEAGSSKQNTFQIRKMFSRFSLLPSVRNVVSMGNRQNNLFRHPTHLLQHASVLVNTNPDVGFINASNATTISIRNFKSVSWRKRSIAIKKRLRQAEQRYKKPGQIQAVTMPLSPQEMDNTMLIVLSQMGKVLFLSDRKLRFFFVN